MSNDKRNLVIAAVGDDSLHRHWLVERPTRQFDVLLVYYGAKENRYESESDFYVAEKGLKWPLLSIASKRFAMEIASYDAIWCPDDDLLIDALSVNALFDWFHKLELNLAQPAMAEGSHVWFQTTRQCPYAIARFVDLVELGAPVFSQEVFQRLAWTFSESETGWGLDLLWGRLLAYEKMAIIHTVAFTHTRPYFAGGSYGAQRPLHDAKRLIEKYAMKSELMAGDEVLSTILRPDAVEYIPRLFEHDLPNALAEKSEVARAIGTRFSVAVSGVGEWLIDASPSGPSCLTGRGDADCSFTFASTDAFFKYLEIPRKRMLGLFLSNDLEISGRETEARKLPRVFEMLFPYQHTDIEFV